LFGEDGDILRVQTADWKDVINSPKMREVRKAQLNGEWHPYCDRCKRESESGMDTRMETERRIWHDFTEEDARAATNEDGSIDPDPVEFIDIRFGNLCNLKCVMCSPTDSSQWYDDYVKLWGWEGFKDTDGRVQLVKEGNRYRPQNNPFEWYDNEHFWQQVNLFRNGFKKMYIVGGEPLIIKEHYDFLQECVDAGIAGNITLEYNTNATTVPQRALDIWKHFKEVRLGISIDAVGEVNDIIRYPSHWDTVCRNIRKLDEADGNYVLWFTVSVSLLNLIDLPRLMKWKLEQNYNRVNTWRDKPIICPHPVHRPPDLNMMILPKELKEEVQRRFDYESMSFTHPNPKIEQDFSKILNSYIDYMWREDRSDELHKFFTYMDRLDDIRGTNWRSAIPELAELLKDYDDKV
jgi:MoaA/NifB/PqqE/SkfB family radical SAM enzyme